MNRKRTLAILPLLGALAVPTLAQASGLGNLTYTDQEVFKSIANFGGEGATKWPSGPSGSNTVIMIHQKLVVMGSNDSGKPPGSFHIYDISDPRHPVLQKTYDGTPETSRIRELHAMPVALVDGKTALVVPTTGGVQFFDFTDPLNPSPLGSVDLSKDGINGGDYDSTLWMLSYEWPYVFAGGTGSGIFVIDATDPAHPSLLTRILTGSIGGFRIGPIYAAGNYVLGLNMDQAPAPTKLAVIDVGNPKTPFLSATGETPFALYSSLVVGDRVYGPGSKGDYAELKWSGTAVTPVATSKNGTDRGGYCAFQSPFLICGQSSEGFKKWDTTGDKLTFMGNGRDQDPSAATGDFDFATSLGNLIYLGNDHGSGAALIPHQTAMDTMPPAVLKVYPSEAKQPVTSRITIFFTEDIDLDTVNATNIVVRTVAGEVVPGNFSKSSFDAISFGPKAPLAANTTYEVYVPAGGVQDLVGNKSTVASTVRFSTGPTIDTTGIPVGGGAGAGGASGQAGAAGAAAAGASAGGAPAQGGAPAVGGGSESAGAPVTASGGSTPASSGGSAGSVAPQPANPPASGSCSCSMPGGTTNTSAWALGIGAMCIGLGRLRGRNRRRAGTRQA